VTSWKVTRRTDRQKLDRRSRRWRRVNNTARP